MRVMVTGSAGFIGSALSLRLLARGDEVVGIDCLDSYYDVALKQARLDRCLAYQGFHDLRIRIEDRPALEQAFGEHAPELVVHLAAQAGVRHSIESPYTYIDSNLVGFGNILECSRQHPVQHLVYASSSSVYGAHSAMPFSTRDSADHPVSLYAATKRANELMAHSYSHLYRIPTTGLRFFTVYGPWGRPDMALFKFTRDMLAGRPIPVYNHGRHRRDFTYIDDIIEGLTRVLDRPAQADPDWLASAPDSATSDAPFRLYNIGNNAPVELLEYIETLEACLGVKATMDLLPLQPGDVPDTYADVAPLVRDFDYRPCTDIKTGIARFVEWYRGYYRV